MTEDEVENAKLIIQKQKEANRELSEELGSLRLEVRFFEQQQRLEAWSQNWRQRRKEERLRQKFQQE
eukprot:1787420-Alexandrium_andersonii.AAC.1